MLMTKERSLYMTKENPNIREKIKNSIKNNLTTIVKLKLIENYNSFRNTVFEKSKLLSI